MKMINYIEKQGITMKQAAEDLNFTYEDVRRYCKGEIIPRPDKMNKIVKWSGGEVQPNDFYEVK